MTAFSNTTDKRSLSPIKKHKNKIYLGIIVGAIIIAGFLLSGGTTPNSNIGSVFDPLPVYKSGAGAINGYVFGPLGLPAIGSTIIAAEQGGSSLTKSGFISIDGKYVFSDLPPGEYIIMVAFPDGANKVLNKVVVGPGSVQTINFKY
jgi:hypothetical protein